MLNSHWPTEAIYADCFRDTLADRGMKPCISGRKSCNKVVRYDQCRCRRGNRIARMRGRLKDWRRVSTRYDRCPMAFLSAIALAAIVIFWLWVLTLEPSGHGDLFRRLLANVGSLLLAFLVSFWLRSLNSSRIA